MNAQDALSPDASASHLFGWSATTWTWLSELAALVGLVTTALTLLLALWAWVRRDRLRAWWRNNRFPRVGGLVPADACWSAILFTVSQVEVPVWVMQRARPNSIGLIGTAASQASVAALREQAEAQGIRVLTSPPLTDPDDPAQSRAAARGLLAELRAAGITNVAVDVTGGKVPMSLGAFMAAEEARIDSIYVSVEYENRRPRPETARIRRVSGQAGGAVG